MLDLGLHVEATQDAITDTRPTAPVTAALPPILITEHEVMFGTAAAAAPQRTPVIRRLIDTLRVAAALRPPASLPHYAHRARYLENACMSREMGRL